jgi:hypothetical protein
MGSAVAKKARPNGGIRTVKPTARSRISNGAALLPGIDGRSALARRFRDIAGQIAGDLGGADRLSEVKLQLIRRFAGAAALAEQLEANIANGKPVDIAEHAALTSSLVRISSRIGLSRAMKTVPTLDEYLAGQSTGDGDEE